jgi:HTH-type transcriptional repressor of NAD biosynthesis genes
MKIAILGAECSGKTTLAKRLVEELTHQGFSACSVDEVLREWCATQQRTPQASEQREIARLQIERVHNAPACDYLIADTTALMTAIYSEVLFNDVSLYPLALKDQQRFDLVCVMGLDLPWVADGIQRDGLAMQAKVDTQLRHILQSQGIAFSVIYGTGEERLGNALAANAKARHQPQVPIERDTPWQWVCDKCSDAQCEHRTFSALLDAKPTP